MSVDVVGAGAGKIGRYFTIVSALPSTVFACYLYMLVKTTDWFGPVDWSRMSDFRPQDLAVLGVAALVLALALNPLQFPLVQIFEGYWGTSALAVQMAAVRVAHHDRRRLILESRAGEPRLQRGAIGPGGIVDENLPSSIAGNESRRLRGIYPKPQRILPTRLGNALRRWEDAIGEPYGLDPLVSVPRLAMVASQAEVSYVQNQRIQMELALRTTFLALVASLLTIAFFSRSGAWLVFAIVPYAVAYLTYRGAVNLAAEYGTSLAVLTEMNRFRLYARLHLPMPGDTRAEREQNETLMRLFKLRNTGTLAYEHHGSFDASSEAAGPEPTAADET